MVDRRKESRASKRRRSLKRVEGNFKKACDVAFEAMRKLEQKKQEEN
jgi:hypothetical protein